jgi:hypothetical protein
MSTSNVEMLANLLDLMLVPPMTLNLLNVYV